MGRGTLGEIWDGLGSLGKLRNGSRDPQGGLGLVGGPSGRSGTCRGTLKEVWDVSGNPRGGPGQIWVFSMRYKMGRGTLMEVQDGSGVSR